MSSREEKNKDKQEHLETIERNETIKKGFILFIY